MEKIFSDFEILVLEKDPLEPGVFLKARKPLNYKPNNLKNIKLYSMILGKRTSSIPEISQMPLRRKIKIMTMENLKRILRVLYSKTLNIL